MRDNKPIAIAAGVVILGAWLALGFQLSGGFGPRLNTAAVREAGRVLADQAVARLKPGGTITVVTRDTASFENPASEILLTSFRAELLKKGTKLDELKALQIDPLRPSAVPAGDFFVWIKNAPPESVIVSFMGPPILTEAQLAQLGAVKPALVAFCSGSVRDQVDLRGLFSQGLLQAAVVSRRPIMHQARPPATDREAFTQQYVEVTSSDLSSLSPASK